MTYHALEESPRADAYLGAPGYVRAAAVRQARAFRVLRLYKRRGWNPSAVVTEYTRAREAMGVALEQWEQEESNPPLF